MIILNPFEPWPGELCLDAAARNDVKVITRVVDYGGLFWGDLRPGMELAQGDHRAFRPEGWIEAGLEKLEPVLPIAERARLTPIQLACQWNLAHPAVECVVPTLIQEAGEEACPIEAKRVELANLPAEQRLSDEDVAAIRAVGDNTGCMALKGANPGARGRGAPRPLGARRRARRGGRALGHRPRSRSRRPHSLRACRGPGGPSSVPARASSS